MDQKLKTLHHIIAIGLLSLFLVSCSKGDSSSSDDDRGPNLPITPKVVYGEDNRLDLYQVNSSAILSLAESTVALVKSNDVKQINSTTSRLSSRSYADSYQLCASEPFYEQNTGAFCSGFLVAPNMIVTAGHCIKTSRDCSGTKFVFNYAYQTQSDTPEILNTSDIYSCAEVVYSEVKGSGSDFAVVRLDRDVMTYQPLAIRRSGNPKKGDSLMVIGHPAGLPTKVAAGAEVSSLSETFFTTNLDTYGGNSGSAVFNAVSGEVEGILVRGATDYVYKRSGRCYVSNTCSRVSGSSCQGEDVTRIARALSYIPEQVVVPPVTPDPPELGRVEYKSEEVLRIPDNSRSGVISKMEIKELPQGRTVQIKVDIDHTWRGDLEVSLVSSSGKTYRLHRRRGGSANNIKGIYGADLQASDDLSELSDLTVSGIWELRIADRARRDLGQLNSWSVIYDVR